MAIPDQSTVAAPPVQPAPPPPPANPPAQRSPLLAIVVVVSLAVVVVACAAGWFVYRSIQNERELRAQLQLQAFAVADAATKAELRQKELEAQIQQQASAAADAAAKAELRQKELQAQIQQQASAAADAAAKAELRQREEQEQAQRRAKAAEASAEAAQKRAQAERTFDRLLESVRSAQLRADGFERDLLQAAKTFMESPGRSSFDLMKSSAVKMASERKAAARAAQELERFASSAEISAETRKDFEEKQRGPLVQVKSSLDHWNRFDTWISSIQTKSLTVASNKEWQSSGATAGRGDLVAVNSSGQWRWGTWTANWVGAEGEPAGRDWRTEPAFGNGALLARVGGGQSVLGAGVFRSEQVGEVQFRINDTKVSDNQGELQVDFWVIPEPAHLK